MNNTTITITTGTILRTLLIFGLCWVLFFLRDLVIIILTAIVIASSLEPAITWMKKVRISRIPSVIIVYLLLAILLVAGVYFFIPPLLSQSVDFLNRLPTDIRSIDLNDLTKGPSILTSEIPGLGATSLSSTVGDARSIVSVISGNFIKTTGIVFGGVISFILIVVLSFYFAVQDTGIDDFLRVITPVRYQDYVVGLWRRSQAKIGLWMQGQVVLGLIVGVLVYLGLMVLGVPYAFFLAIISAVFELIPVFGPIIGAIPAVLIGFSDGGTTLGLFVAGLYVIVQQFESHLIYPLVVRKIVGLPPVLVILALIIGAKLAGFLGVLLSVPLSAAIKEYFDDIVRSKEAERRKLGLKASE
jgi:predicted PurR-regulated permease PerM